MTSELYKSTNLQRKQVSGLLFPWILFPLVTFAHHFASQNEKGLKGYWWKLLLAMIKGDYESKDAA